MTLEQRDSWDFYDGTQVFPFVSKLLSFHFCSLVSVLQIKQSFIDLPSAFITSCISATPIRYPVRVSWPLAGSSTSAQLGQAELGHWPQWLHGGSMVANTGHLGQRPRWMEAPTEPLVARREKHCCFQREPQQTLLAYFIYWSKDFTEWIEHFKTTFF